jgi:hypothetical protein
MNRRGLLAGFLALGAAGLLVPELVARERRYFLPPRGGWLRPRATMVKCDVAGGDYYDLTFLCTRAGALAPADLIGASDPFMAFTFEPPVLLQVGDLVRTRTR